jgi:nucleoside-diphosphate-sugar epimerase
MPTLLCFGLGYSAEHFVATYGDGFERIIGTVRTAERATVLSEHLAGRLKALVFDGTFATPEVRAAIDHADAVLVSVPPDENGDPVLHAFGDALAHAPHIRTIVYLSTIGVYGDHAGAWIDEDAATHPVSERSRERLAAEQAWQKLGERRGIAVAILRLAGIYGPGQNALLQIAGGRARRIAKPGQVFNRIHVADIAQAIDAAFARNIAGAFNVTDDEPTPTGDPIVFAAHLLGKEPPPEIPFDEAAKSMSPMALSFWAECKRVHNDRLKRGLGVTLQYPTYRDGLRALFDAGDHRKAR